MDYPRRDERGCLPKRTENHTLTHRNLFSAPKRCAGAGADGDTAHMLYGVMRRLPACRRALVPILSCVVVALVSPGNRALGADARAIPRNSGIPSALTRSAVPNEAGVPPATTHVSMRHVDFYVDPEVVLHIRRLDGTMRARNGGPVVFDDKRSFIITLDRAEVGLTGADLTALLNKYVFGYRGSPLSHLKLRTEGDHIVQSGRLHKGIDLPFEMTATMDVTADGLIRIHPTKTKILGVNGDKLMHAFGLSLEKLIDLKGATGATVHGNDLFLDATRILPPPTIEGRITAVRIEGDEVVQQFGAPGADDRRALVPPDTTAPNYMYYKGGTLRFGKLLMLDAEMQIVDLDPRDVFKFDLGRYSEQLVAGYERTLSDQGLEVWMRDVDKLGAPGQLARSPELPAHPLSSTPR